MHEGRKTDYPELIERKEAALRAVREKKKEYPRFAPKEAFDVEGKKLPPKKENVLFTTTNSMYGQGESMEIFKQLTTVPVTRTKAKDLMPANAVM